jgi:predicted Zn-dependent peptidase
MITGLILFFLSTGCVREQYRVIESTDASGYHYTEVSGDPLHVRIYTLANGLKVYLSKNNAEPRIQTIIGVHAGSTYDPPETTGLAHYFEHMMFKGTDKIATWDWEDEKPLLEEISDLFEQYRTERHYKKKKEIYHKIDSVSQLAAQYAIPNEYDKLTGSIGARGVNAGTSYDFTQFTADIPSNELKKWAELESERFQHMVLRLFHTELETVYEEFNMYQDDDNTRAQNMLLATLFPTHPYGRDVIGLPEHIKNPSIRNIYKFAEKYYVPNNMAIALAGDLDYEAAIRIIDHYFGDMKKKEVTPPSLPHEPPLEGPIEKTVTGPSAESVLMGFRFKGANSEDEKYVTLIDMILNNSKAGLIDLDLKQKQKVLLAGCGPYKLRDYIVHSFYGAPRQGQSLEEVRDLLLEEIEKVKKGNFDDWLIQAVINNMRRSEMEQMENNTDRAYTMMESFTLDIPWPEKVRYYDELEKITKAQLVAFAREHYNNNYVVVYKRTGITDKVVKVEKPEITPLKINREKQSDFYKKFTAEKVSLLRPVFVDFDRAIRHDSLAGGIRIDYIPNETNDLFTLEYLLDMGRDHDRMLSLAVQYLPYLGTDRYTAEAFQKELYRLGIDLSVYTSSHRTYLRLSGLQESLGEGVRLLEHLVNHVVPDEKAWQKYVEGILKNREDAKKNKNRILWGALRMYGEFGKNSPYTNILQPEELRNTDPAQLTDLVKDLFHYKHYIFYYGTEDVKKIIPVLEHYHHVKGPLKAYPPKKIYPERKNREEVFFINYDMVQANLLMMARDTFFDVSQAPYAYLFNEYFGSGLSSIVFQEVREAKALAYSAFAMYTFAAYPEYSNYVEAFVGTQADKLENATMTLLGLLNEMPHAQKQFDLARENILERIQTERITGTEIYSTWLNNKDHGINHDLRKDVYEGVEKMTMDELENFFATHIKGKAYTFLVLGNKENLDMSVLERLGSFRELTLEEVFGY